MSRPESNNARIGRWAGHSPRISWELLNPEGNATAFSGESEREVEEWFTDHLRRCPNSWLRGHHVGSWEFWPDYEHDLAKASSLLETLVEKGFNPLLHHLHDGWNVQIWGAPEIPAAERLKAAAKDESLAKAISAAVLELIDRDQEPDHGSK